MANFELSRRKVLCGIGTTCAGFFATTGVLGPSRYVVGVTNGRGRKIAVTQADSVTRTLDFGRIGSAVVGQWPQSVLYSLSQRIDVRYVEPDIPVKRFGQSTPCGVSRIEADRCHENGKTGDGSHVAVIDTGIEPSHADLDGNLGKGKAWVDCDDSEEDCDEPWDDDYGHGTACAGIVGAEDNSRDVVGVAPDTTLHSAKVLGADGRGYSSDVADALRWTADNGYDVANLSLGTDGESEVMKDGVEYAYSHGVLVAAAAGNYGPCEDCVAYPAAYEAAIAVSAVDCDGDWESYSCQGPEIGLAGIAGVTTTSASGGTRGFAGTSCATPHVAGAGALLMANGYSHSEARKRLRDTAEDIGLSSNRQGHGLVNADKAVLGDEGDGGDDDDGGDDGDNDDGDGGGSDANYWWRVCIGDTCVTYG